MRLSEALRGLPARFEGGNPDIRGVTHDSRCVQPGDAFVCLEGQHTDGHLYIGDAVARGAVAVICTHPLATDVPLAFVPDTRLALAYVAARLAGLPAQRLQVVGVTGTNGKSTTVAMLHRILAARGPAGMIGTVRVLLPSGEALESIATTPDSTDLQLLLRRMADQQAWAVAMEVSSHALSQRRTVGVPFRAAVFTNLTRDHLDFHGCEHNYAAAKRMLFEPRSGPCGDETAQAAVLNADDPFSQQLAEASRGPIIWYGLRHAGDLTVGEVIENANGLSMEVMLGQRRALLTMPVRGRFNVPNALAALGAAVVLDLDFEWAVAQLCGYTALPGRAERIDEGQPFEVIVDFAHNPDGLRQVLALTPPDPAGRRILVFGAEGQKDRGKRPQMGREARRLADIAIITSDNPHKEDPEAIIADIRQGMREGHGQVEVIPDRREAIRYALRAAQPGDLVIVAGKGHERTLVGAQGAIPFADVDVIREELAALGYLSGRLIPHP